MATLYFSFGPEQYNATTLHEHFAILALRWMHGASSEPTPQQ
jgi:hypothetical protein